MRKLAFALLLVLASTVPVIAAESLCGTMGSTCLCSEPLQATTWTTTAGAFHNPTDSTTKECTFEDAVLNAAVVTNGSIVIRNDAQALNALPSGHSVQRYWSRPSGSTGGYNIGRGASSSPNVPSNIVRVAARFYVWYSSDHEFKTEGQCQNTKFMELQPSGGIAMVVDITAPTTIHQYSFLGGSPSVDCCGGGGPDGLATAELKGRWWRFEAVVTGLSGPNYRFRLYAKNITDNGAERLVLDSSQQFGSTWTPTARALSLATNGHRFPICTGYAGWMYYLYAGWTTDAGQRIGAATEVEGGGGPVPQAPVAPTGLTVGPS